jgi:2-polyprenyl-3-methyl-5-hydroxy-6-metoxy-1,4-benzoquinol methylase
MLDEVADVQRLIGQMNVSVWSLAALQAAAEAGLLAALAGPSSADELSRQTGLEPAIVTALLDLLATHGLVAAIGDRWQAAPGLRPLLAGPAAEAWHAALRSTSLQSQAMVAAARAGQLAGGWRHTDAETLQAQGLATAPLFRHFAQAIFPRLDGLIERLAAPTATFLDVGFGVGAIAPVMCQLFPALRIVGLEPQALPRQLAAERLAATGLTERVEVRAQLVEELTERTAYDLVWLPQVFLPAEVFLTSLTTTYAALRPGGWLVTITGSLPGAEPAAAAARLVNVLVGGPPRLPAEAADRLTAAGLTAVQSFAGPPGTPFTIIAGRRPA